MSFSPFVGHLLFTVNNIVDIFYLVKRKRYFYLCLAGGDGVGVGVAIEIHFVSILWVMWVSI